MMKHLIIFSLVTGLCFLSQAETGNSEPVQHDESGAHDVQPADSNAKTQSVFAKHPPEAVHGVHGRKPWNAVELLEKGAFFTQQRDFILAERTFVEVLEGNYSPEDKQQALVELAEVYYQRGVITKAVDTLENFLRTFPDVNDRPEILFRLAEFYREMELENESIAMFYRVLNSIVVTGESSLNKYISLARLAQFEIARGHYEQAEYERAFLLFDRIELLELNPTDRETVFYYKILATVKAGHYEKELSLLHRFAKDFPNSEYLPEIIYLEAEALYRMKRMKESEEALMRLLDIVGLPETDSSKRSLFWRQQAGNRLANRFYDDGNFIVALRIYQGMVPLDSKLSWQLPVIYQIGLCFEKLSMYDRATESYQYISNELAKIEDLVDQPNLSNLGECAQWRLNLLSWRNDLTEKVDQLVVNMISSKPNSDPET